MKKTLKTKVVEFEIEAMNCGCRYGTVRVRVPHDTDEIELEELAEWLVDEDVTEWDDNDLDGCWEVRSVKIKTLKPTTDSVDAEYRQLGSGEWERRQ